MSELYQQSANAPGDSPDTYNANISSAKGIAIGRGTQAIVTEGINGDETARLFAEIYRQINARAADLSADKTELAATVQKIQQETIRGDQADPGRIAQWLRTLAEKAPQIFDLTIARLTSPAATAVAVTIINVAKQIWEEYARLRGVRFTDLLVHVDASDLPHEVKVRMQADLDVLRSQVERGDEGDAKLALKLLREINKSMPALRKPLWDWLVSSNQAATPIGIIARKVLTAAPNEYR